MSVRLMRVSDYVASVLVKSGLREVFMLTGGGAMHLNDALGHAADLNYTCTHHEQAAAMAAEGYARIAGIPAIVNVTTGPGSINALNGVFGAFTDSVPMLVLSGQVRRDTIVALTDTRGLRQLGDQEVDIVSMARGITKYAFLVSDPLSIRYHLEKALHIATNDRPGPVWLDIPIDVQGAQIDPNALEGFDIDRATPGATVGLRSLAAETLERTRFAKRPVIMIGSGVRISGALPVFERVVHKLGIPVATAWTAIDALASDDPLYCGRPGIVGDRAGNFTVQNADLLIVIGCRLPIRQISYNWKSFAREAYKIIIDIDPMELKKPMILPDLRICADATLFLEELERLIDARGARPEQHCRWLNWCKQRLARYPVVQPAQRKLKNGFINPYYFLECLFDNLNDDDVIVCGDASASVIAFQVAKIKRGQRLFTNAGCASMGYDIPAAVGVAVARRGKRVICLAGDGSAQLNIQELQTIAHHQLPIKLFVLNNGGYLSMRLTQGNFFKRYIGESAQSGVSFPDMLKVATAYGLPAMGISGDDFVESLSNALSLEGPIVCDVLLDSDQGFEPKLSSRQLPDGRIVSAALEDMAPFLPRDELAENMLIPQMDG